MCSSRIDQETGVVTVTTPCAWAEVGHRLHTLWSAATYEVSPADWLLRLLRPPEDHGRPGNEGHDTTAAVAALKMRLAGNNGRGAGEDAAPVVLSDPLEAA